MNRYPHVFQPLQLRKVTVKNRLELTPFVPCQVDSEGGVTQGMIDFIRMQARTGAGIIVMGCITDTDRRLSMFADVDITSDKYVPGLSLLCDEAHKYGAKLAYELSHSGRGDIQSAKEISGAAGMTDEVPVPTLESAACSKMTRSDMDWLIDHQVQSVKRAIKAGFDMIFIHGGHNAFLSTWLSPLTNHRTDEYGGSLENRMRFPLEFIKAIREAVGEDVPIEVRASAADMIEGGIVEEECLAFFQAAEPYIDLAHVSRGNCMDARARSYTSPMYTMKHRINEEVCAKLKKLVKIPVTCVGNIWSLEDAEEMLAAGHADVIGFCRSILADPQLFVKSAAGKVDEVRPCLKCMDGCGRIFHGLPARCAVNPELGYETEARQLQPAKEHKKVLVIGAGPAGMMAAQLLTKRGHEVVLVEKSDTLGGRLHDAGKVSFKGLMRDYLAYMIRTTEKCGAEIRLNTEATEELVKEINADAIVVATGSNYIKPGIPGIDGKNVHMLADVENGDVKLGKKVIVCGGGLSGMESSVDFANAGSDVTVIDMIPTEKFCSNLFMFAYDALFMEIDKAGVKLQGSSRIMEFNDKGVVVERNGALETMECDDVVIALGLKSENKLAKALAAADPMNVYVIGDADHVANIRNATRMAYDAMLSMESRCL